MLDRHDCYELCVQSPRHVVAMLRGIHGNEPLVLREDFCGSAAVGRRWCVEGASRGDGARAVGVDLDTECLARAARLALDDRTGDRLNLLRADAVHTPPDSADGADIVFVGNFSIGYIHLRSDLLTYLRHCRDRLVRGQGGFGGGVFVCDLYGGSRQFQLGSLDRTHMSRGPEVIKYHWEHEEADPLTGIVTNSISFKVILDGELQQDLPRAFVYRWRLWSIPELTDAFLEAGFTSTDIYKDLNLAPGQPAQPVTSPDELGPDWIVMVAARV
jgi:hypothetical protein